jgi:hypothetical protein
VSVIDYLQTFDRGKKNEVIAKRLFKNADINKLSARPPDAYGLRFTKFVKDTVFQYDKVTNKSDHMDIEKMRLETEDHIKKEIARKIKELFMKSGKFAFKVNRENEELGEQEG